MRMKKKKICLVSSSGGHLFLIMSLKDWWQEYERFWVVRDDIISKDLLRDERRCFGYFPENRNMLNFWRNLFLAFRILKKEKPDVIFSTGAGIAPPFFIVAKIMGVKTVFMELFIFAYHPTVSGKIISFFTDVFLVQQKKLLRKYPKAKYWGRVT